MSVHLTQLIQQYGYPAISLGVMIEGESMLMAAAFAISKHLLQFWPVIIAAVLGATVIDHVYFYLGRTQGLAWLNKHPPLKKRGVKLMAILERHQLLVLLSLRFLIGLRTVTPIVLGLTGVSRKLFSVCNVISAIAWAIVVTWLGHRIVMVVHDWLGHVQWHQHRFTIIFSFAALAVAIGLFSWWRARRPDPNA